MCFNVWQGYRKQEWPFYYKLAPRNCDGDTLNIEEPPNGHLAKAATSSFPGWLDTSTGGGPKCHPPWILQAKDKGAICVSTLSGNTLAWRLSNVKWVCGGIFPAGMLSSLSLRHSGQKWRRSCSVRQYLHKSETFIAQKKFCKSLQDKTKLQPSVTRV